MTRALPFGQAQNGSLISLLSPECGSPRFSTQETTNLEENDAADEEAQSRQRQREYISMLQDKALKELRVVHSSFNSAYPGGGYSLPRQTHASAERDASWSPQPRKIEDDIARNIDLVLDSDDEDAYDNRQLYGILYTSTVGNRYYKGKATVREYSMVQREPGNPYDPNAIRIDNVRRHGWGHVGRDMAATLALPMDFGELSVEGALTGTKGGSQSPVGLKLFGTASHPEKWALRSKMLEFIFQKKWRRSIGARNIPGGCKDRARFIT